MADHKRVVLYSRVSTHHGQDPELQLRELREYAAARGWRITREYTDTGITGSKESRPALHQLMADASRRKFDVILIWKLDRFGRSLRHLVNALAEREALGVAFVSLRDNLDLSTPSGRLMFQIVGAMAEFERSLIQERVKAGLRNAKAKGKRLDRPRVVVDQLEVLPMRNAGASWRTIAEKLGGRGRNRSQNRSAGFQKPLRQLLERWSGGGLCLTPEDLRLFVIGTHGSTQSTRRLPPWLPRSLAMTFTGFSLCPLDWPSKQSTPR